MFCRRVWQRVGPLAWRVLSPTPRNIAPVRHMAFGVPGGSTNLTYFVLCGGGLTAAVVYAYKSVNGEADRHEDRLPNISSAAKVEGAPAAEPAVTEEEPAPGPEIIVESLPAEPAAETSGDLEETSAEPVEVTSAEPVEETLAEPVEVTSAEPVEETSAEPVEETSAEPLEVTSAEPVEETSAEPVEGTSAEPVEGTSAEPVEETSAEPVEVTSAEPVEGTSAEPVEGTSAEPVEDAASEVVITEASAEPGITEEDDPSMEEEEAAPEPAAEAAVAGSPGTAAVDEVLPSPPADTETPSEVLQAEAATAAEVAA